MVPTTACTPLSAHQSRLPRAASTTVKSTATSAPASASAVGGAGDVHAARGDAELLEVDAGMVRVDGGHELELGVGRDRPHTVEPIRPPAPKTPTRTMP